MNYSNQSFDELARTAEYENNALALAILETDQDDITDPLTNLIDDIIQHQADEIDEKLQAHINDYYLNSESDYFDFLYMFADENLETDSLSQYMANNEIELDIEIVKDRLNCMLDYYCEVEINRNYSASSGIAVSGASIGEIEEQIDFLSDLSSMSFSDTETADKIWAGTLESLSTCTVNKDSDYVYFDFSDTFASLVVKADMLDELFAPEED